MKLLETKWYWLWVSFITGAASMALEITAARLLAPKYGSSTLVWSSVIGIVLLTLSAGYYAGGKLAEWKLEGRILLRIILAGGFCALFIPIISRPLLNILSDSVKLGDNLTFFLVMGSLLSSLLLFGLPVFFMGCVSPYLLSLLAQRFGHLGTTAGQLFTISTIGGLAGTFMPTLLLVPLIGTTRTILSIAAILIITGLPGVISPRGRTTALMSLLVLAVLGVHMGNWHPAEVLAQAESSYQHIMITKQDNRRFMQFDAGFGYQSVYDPDRLLTGYYFDYASVLPSILQTEANKKTNILIIGLAGGTLPRQLHAYYGNSITMTAVEIDPISTKLANEYMGLSGVPLRVFSQDGRPFLSDDRNKYDLIVVDAYQNELQIPWTLTTKEFWQQVQSHLTDHGIAAMNLVALGAQESSLVHAVTNTQAHVFPYVYDMPLHLNRDANHLVLLSNSPIETRPTDRTPGSIVPLAEYMTLHITRRIPDSRSPILTDDRAPIEWLMAMDASR